MTRYLSAIMPILILGLTHGIPVVSMPDTDVFGAGDGWIQLAQMMTERGNYKRAESYYRKALSFDETSREIRLEIARTLLWQKKYAHAEKLIHGLLGENPNDAEAHELLGISYYWSGAWRKAVRAFKRSLILQPALEQARSFLEEIEYYTTHSVEITAVHLVDDQPMDKWITEVQMTLFSDPLMQWTLSGGAFAFDTEILEKGSRMPISETAPYVQIEAGIKFGRPVVGLESWAMAVNFPAGGWMILGGGRMLFPAMSRIRTEIEYGREEIRDTNISVNREGYFTYGEVRLKMDGLSDWYGLLSGRKKEYFDGNSGREAVGYIVFPVSPNKRQRNHRVRLHVWAGVSAVYRDTDASRYRAFIESVVPAEDDLGALKYRWQYDPYYTPLNQREFRAEISAELIVFDRFKLKTRGNYGTAWEDIVQLLPEQESAAQTETRYDRRYRPWSMGAEASLQIARRFLLKVTYDRAHEAYYQKDEYKATLVGRF